MSWSGLTSLIEFITHGYKFQTLAIIKMTMPLPFEDVAQLSTFLGTGPCTMLSTDNPLNLL